MHGNLVITIGRECGSGGRFIGQKLADRLGIKCYDKELLTLAAQNSGLCEELSLIHISDPRDALFQYDGIAFKNSEIKHCTFV